LLRRLLLDASNHTGSNFNSICALAASSFGGEDVKAAEAQGYSAAEIFDYVERAMKTNPNILQGGNVKGAAGGVYETLRAAAGR
jgi:hypothetical protein